MIGLLGKTKSVRERVNEILGVNEIVDMFLTIKTFMTEVYPLRGHGNDKPHGTLDMASCFSDDMSWPYP